MKRIEITAGNKGTKNVKTIARITVNIDRDSFATLAERWYKLLARNVWYYSAAKKLYEARMTSSDIKQDSSGYQWHIEVDDTSAEYLSRLDTPFDAFLGNISLLMPKSFDFETDYSGLELLLPQESIGFVIKDSGSVLYWNVILAFTKEEIYEIVGTVLCYTQSISNTQTNTNQIRSTMSSHTSSSIVLEVYVDDFLTISPATFAENLNKHLENYICSY